MPYSKVSIKHVNNEHSDWLRALDFYKSELQVLKSRLTEVAGKNTSNEVNLFAGHYENQIKLQTTNIDTLRHNINEVLSAIAEQAQDNVGYIDEKLLAAHNRLREKYIVEETVVNALRHEFNVFAAKWM
ncbi:MAG: hypothetical protein JST82_11570 [Bacteroidetes bacterium]|nr:hypothetical protein [Bacteroidota bacterium]